MTDARYTFTLLDTDRAAEAGKDKITLTVNKNNLNSISIYKRMGFEIEGELITDIGGGFVMDDYLMVMRLEQ